MKKLATILLLCFLSASGFAQAVEGDSCGHQIKRHVPISQFTGSLLDSAWSLIYYPDEYKDSTTKRYPLIFFCHGSGEGDSAFFPSGSNGSHLCNLLNQALPGQIAAGLKPMGVSSGKTYKFIVVSIQVWKGGSPGYSTLVNAYPYLKSILRIDTNRMYITGLSEGGYGTWDVLTNGTDSSFIKKFAAIIPQSAVTLEGFRLPYLRIASRDTLPVLVTCGGNDSFLPSSEAYVDSINTANPTPYVPAIMKVMVGQGHAASSWDSIYSVTFRPTETGGLNGYEWMLQYVAEPRGPLNPNAPPTANAGGNQTITLPTNSVTCSGSGTGQNGATISSYAWTQTSGPTTASLSGQATATLTASSLNQGTYVFTLTVTDNNGHTGSNAATITVNAAPVNTPPNVNAGTDQNIFLPATSTTLTGTASGNNGASIAAVTWTQTAGPTTATYSPNNAVLSITVSGLSVGSYIFSFTAQDNRGLTNTAIVTVVVSPASSFVPKYIFGPSEYGNIVINTATHHATNVGADTFHIAGMPDSTMAAGGGIHHQGVLDIHGNAFLFGDNSSGQLGNGTVGGSTSTYAQITTDSLGNPFTGIAQLELTGSTSGSSSFFRKSDGTVWGCGDLRGGLRGNNTTGGICPRPVQIPFPPGVFIVKIQISVVGIALDANGNVYTWGDNNGDGTAPYVLAQGTLSPVMNVPTMISLPSPAKDISGSSYWSYALLTNGSLYGWGYYAGFLMYGTAKSSPAASTSPVLLDSYTHFPKPIASIYTNNVASYAILTDSTLWGWGDQAVGALGNGVELNYFTYTNNPAPRGGTPAPFLWNQSPGDSLQITPIQIAPGIHSFTNVFVSRSLNFYTVSELFDGTVLFMGRDKGGVAGRGFIGADTITAKISAQYANSWDVPWITVVDPYHSTHLIPTSSPYCVDSSATSPCNVYSIPVVAAPNCSAGSNQTISGSSTTLSATVSANGSATIFSTVWTCTSKPAGAPAPIITLNSGTTAQVSGLVTGIYTFQEKATDNTFRSTTSSMTVTVGAQGCNCLNFNLPTKIN